MTDRMKVLLPPDVEAWYEEALRTSREAIEASWRRVVETAQRKGVSLDGKGKE